MASQLDLQKEALVYIEELNKKTRETVHLVVMEDFDIVYISKVESSQSLRIGTPVGGRLPAHCAGIGKVFLAALSSDDMKTFLKKRPLKKFTPNTIIDPQSLEKTLAQIRALGYALDNEEFSAGLMYVAAPIKDYSQKIIGTISVSGPTYRIQEKNVENLIGLVKGAAREISRRLGFSENSLERMQR